MKKKDWVVAIVAGLLIGIIASIIGAPGLLAGYQSAQATGTLNQALTLVLNSHTKWRTAKGEAEITWYGPNGDKQTYIDRFQIVQPLSAYVDGVNKDQPGFNDDGIWISNGTEAYTVSKKTNTFRMTGLPKFASDLSRMPKTLAEVQTDTVYSHPFAMLISDPVTENIYSEWFAQGAKLSTFTLDGEGNLLGRRAWIITAHSQTDGITAWIDQATGMILKYIQIQDGKKFAEAAFTSLVIDQPIDAVVFRVPAQYHLAEQP
ncbi:MAG: hypothetical protein WA821_02490 [Anaerolineales bacterium]